MPTLERRITATIDTIPASTALSGTVTTSTVDSTVLFYTGPVDLEFTYRAPIAAKSLYVWVTAGTPQISRVAGVSQISLTSGTYVFNIQLVTGISGASASAIRLVNANLLGLSVLNDGGADGTVNGVTLKDGEDLTLPQLSPAGSRVTFQSPVLADASATDFLVVQIS